MGGLEIFPNINWRGAGIVGVIGFPRVFRMITQNLLMFEIDETRYYYSARVFKNVFLYEGYVHT